MENATRTYSKPSVTYTIDNNMKVLLNIKENKYDIPIESLFKIAARKNKKRSFLFVSRVIGKHIPQNPNTLRIVGAILAYLYLEDSEGIKSPHIKTLIDALNDNGKIPEALDIIKEPLKLKVPTLFIGFAETATGISHAVFENFSNAKFIHTTREEIETLKPALNFLEEHSHARDQIMYPKDEGFLHGFEKIVLIDDEITTGKTALNLIKELPGKYFGILSILDWRDDESLDMFNKEKSKDITVSSLIKGTIECTGLCDLDRDPVEVIDKCHIIESKELIFPLDDDIEGYNLLEGRFGITFEDNKKLYNQGMEVSNALRKERINGNCLCVGTGEFIYLPCLISSKLGDEVVFQSTTRSPIYSRNGEYYGIQNKVEFLCHDDKGIPNYLYNIPKNFYSQIFLFSEKPMSQSKKEEFKNIFSHFGVKSLIFVTWEAKNINPTLSGSYTKDDVVFLLKEISGLVEEQSNEAREKAIQSGTHYSEMLPIEYHPKKEYMDVFYSILEDSKEKIAESAAIVSEKILKHRGKDIVLVSLARAGTPIGILIKRYMKLKYEIDIPHYSISIIRGRGIDENAINYILKNHPGLEIQFIDGWTGKGAIQNTLTKACKNFYDKYKITLNDSLAVLSDPAYCAEIYGTREDFLIPSACLNATVSGLMSRTFYSDKIISKYDFHGAKFYKEWMDIDVSNYYVDTITNLFKDITLDEESLVGDKPTFKGLEDIKGIQKDFAIRDINLIKPGVGETTRVLLRRIPWKILIDSFDNPNLKHILILAKDRTVPVLVYKNMSYSCCGLIKPLDGSIGDI